MVSVRPASPYINLNNHRCKARVFFSPFLLVGVFTLISGRWRHRPRYCRLLLVKVLLKDHFFFICDAVEGLSSVHVWFGMSKLICIFVGNVNIESQHSHHCYWSSSVTCWCCGPSCGTMAFTFSRTVWRKTKAF